MTPPDWPHKLLRKSADNGYSGGLDWCGTSALEVLQSGHGVVYAVFDSTAYLQSLHSASKLCCIGASPFSKGPLNISASAFQARALQQGDKWVYKNHCLTLSGQYHFHTSAMRIWQPPPVCVIDESSPGTPGLRHNLTRKLTGNIDLAIDHSANQRVERQLDCDMRLLGNWFYSPDDTPIPMTLTRLLGCGGGLTPAGDDILVGVLVTAVATKNTHKAGALSDWVRQHVQDLTSSISAAHLLAACNGQAIDALHHFINTALQHDVDQCTVETAAQQLQNYGNSSGYYALLGSLIVLDGAVGT